MNEKYVTCEAVGKEICKACRMEPICGEKKDCEFFRCSELHSFCGRPICGEGNVGVEPDRRDLSLLGVLRCFSDG